LKGTYSYKACLEQTAGQRDRAADAVWDAWHSSFAWVPVLLLLLVAVIFIAKLAGYQPRKRRLESTALILVIVSDVLFFWAFSNTKDGETRAWGIYLALILLIIVNIGALLAFVNVDGIVAARSREREKRNTPPDPYDKGHYPVGQSPRYDTPEPPQPPPPSGYVPPPS
jgi:hypothetical protein